MYGVYDTGPWLGIKMRGNDFVGWIGGGLHTFNLMVNCIKHSIQYVFLIH